MVSRYIVSTFVLVLFCNDGFSSPADRDTRQSRTYGVSNYEINESIKRLEKSVRVLENKLSRHEFREAQVADFSTKTLNALTADHGLNQKNVVMVAKQLSSMEERLLSLDALVTTTDERQRKKLDGLSDGLNRLLISKKNFDLALPPPPGFTPGNPDVEKEVKKVLRRVNMVEEARKRDTKTVKNEIKIVGESLSQHMEQLTQRQDRIWNDWNTCQKEQLQSLTDVSDSLSHTGNIFLEQITEAKKILKKGGQPNPPSDCKRLSNEVIERLDSLDRAYQDQERELATLNQDTHVALQEQKEDLKTLLKETENEKSMISGYFSAAVENLKELERHSKKHLGDLETTLKNIVKENSQDIKSRIESVALALNDKTINIMNALDDTASTAENLQYSMSENFEDLTKDVRGLKKVEQVMLSTADAVLDTKRSIEFGIQQVIIELSDAVKNSGRNIDSTLSDHINNISFAILKNQTKALTNMTSKMESEISQVWRQIGIMYQQIAQSVDILGELKSTTSQQMNASLDKVGTMDGTVGAINNKVADVEDNLNYLLGRLSLVTSEFSHMKTGVGAELDKLRQMAQDFSGDDLVEYEVNRKRSIRPEDRKNFQGNRKHYF